MYTYSDSMDTGLSLAALAVIYIPVLIICIICIVANWKIFKKAGKPGWAAIIPFYNLYVMYSIIYGNGWRFLLLIIPFVNIFIGIKAYFDLAHVYGKSITFGIGLAFFSPIFICILGFGNAKYLGTLNHLKGKI